MYIRERSGEDNPCQSIPFHVSNYAIIKHIKESEFQILLPLIASVEKYIIIDKSADQLLSPWPIFNDKILDQ